MNNGLSHVNGFKNGVVVVGWVEDWCLEVGCDCDNAHRCVAQATTVTNLDTQL